MGGRSSSGNHELDNEVLPGEPLDRQPTSREATREINYGFITAGDDRKY